MIRVKLFSKDKKSSDITDPYLIGGAVTGAGIGAAGGAVLKKSLENGKATKAAKKISKHLPEFAGDALVNSTKKLKKLTKTKGGKALLIAAPATALGLKEVNALKKKRRLAAESNDKKAERFAREEGNLSSVVGYRVGESRVQRRKSKGDDDEAAVKKGKRSAGLVGGTLGGLSSGVKTGGLAAAGLYGADKFLENSPEVRKKLGKKSIEIAGKVSGKLTKVSASLADKALDLSKKLGENYTGKDILGEKATEVLGKHGRKKAKLITKATKSIGAPLISTIGKIGSKVPKAQVLAGDAVHEALKKSKKPAVAVLAAAGALHGIRKGRKGARKGVERKNKLDNNK